MVVTFMSNPIRLFLKINFLILALLIPTMLAGQNVDYFLNQGKIHYELEEYSLAIDNFTTVLEYPQFPKETYQYLASSYILNEEPENAAKIAREGLDEYPEFFRLKIIKGEAYIQFNRDKAIHLFEGVLSELDKKDHQEREGIQTDRIQDYVGRLYQQKAAEAFEEGDLAMAASSFTSAKSYQPEEMSIYNNLAYIFIQKEKWDKAEDILEQGLKRFPDSESMLFMKAQVLDNSGDSEQLLDSLEKLYLADTSNMERAVLYGTSLLNNNRADEANLFFQQKLKEYPKERILYRTLIDINRQRHNQSGLLEVYKMKLDQFSEDKDLLEEYGTELITAQKFREAYTHFDSLSTEYSRPEFAREAAWSLLYAENYEKAEQAYSRYLSEWPEAINLKADYGLTLLENHKPEKAAHVFKDFLEHSSSGWIRLQYAQLLKDEEEIHEQLEALKETDYKGLATWLKIKLTNSDKDIKSEKDYSEIVTDIIDLYQIKQQTVQDEAQKGLQDLRAPYPPLLQTSNELSLVTNELDNVISYIVDTQSFNFSMNVLELAMDTYPNSALLNKQKGKLFYHNANLEKAKDLLKNAARLNPDNKEIHYYLGNIYSGMNEFNKASISFERVLSIDSANEDAYRSLIRESQKHGELDQLCDRWMQRYLHNKDNEILKEYLIDALHRADRFEEAREITE